MRLNASHKFLLGSVVVLAAGVLARAAMEPDDARLFAYQGVLENDGAAVNGAYDLRFALFGSQGADASCLDDASLSSGCGLWSSEHPGVQVSTGRFAVELGQYRALTDAVLSSGSLWLAIAVRQQGGGGFNLLQGKQHIAEVPYAARPAAAENFKVRGNLVVNGTASMATVNATTVSMVNGATSITANNRGLTGDNGAGNFHIDATGTRSDGNIYMNFYSGKGVKFGNGSQTTVASVNQSGGASFSSAAIAGATTVGGDLTVNGNATVSGSFPGRVWGAATSYCNGQSNGYFGCTQQFGAASCTGCNAFSCTKGTARSIASGRCYVPALSGDGYCFTALCVE